LLFHIHEARVLTLEGNRNQTGRSGTLLSQDDVCLTYAWVIFFTDALAVKQDDDVGVLL
ncbi:MAG: hypothetical protein RL529_767, partial [Actinomycetota bacterium]